MNFQSLVSARRLGGAVLVTAALVLGACAQTGGRSAHSEAPVLSSNAVITAQGAFTGDSNHVTTGGAEIVRQDGKWYVKLGEDFFFDGAPDPKVALGNGSFVKEATLASLRSNTGEQLYEIPASLDVADFNQVWIWCEKFAVPLGHANLKLT